jgi:photosystem II stability/assembly factor-like uncharacterized protein
MAKASLVYVGTTNGLITLSDPGGTGRWRQIGTALEGHVVSAVSAEDALTLLVATPDGAQRSDDGGQNWAPATMPGLPTADPAAGPLVATAQGMARWTGAHAPQITASAMAMLSGNQEVLLAATAAGMQRSEDGGATWQAAAVDPELNGTVNVIMPASYHMDQAWAGTSTGQLLRSADRGRTWQSVAQLSAAVLSLAIVRLA